MADPDVLLLDEPVSALPELMRDAIIRELRQLHDSLGITTIHVSHNLDEALSVADRLAIMDVGRLVQVGTPREVLERPVNRFVAEITQSMNVWPSVAASGELRVAGVRIGATHAPDGAYDLVLRPEHIRIEGNVEPAHGLAGRVMESVRASHVILTKVDLGAFQAWARDESFRTPGERVALFIAETAVWLLPH
jgi:ABC-type sulfate/molybdate transport systems ATPase subunit